MIKKLAAAAGVAAGLSLLAPSAAVAYSDTGWQARTVNPGKTVCLANYAFGYTKARGELVVTSGHNVRVTLGTLQRVLTDTGVPVAAAAPEVSLYTHPKAFPAQFQVCAVNQSLKVSYVQMRVILD